MPKLSTLTGRSVYSSSGKRLGLVSHVLFHPKGCEAVGFEIRPQPWLMMVARRSRFLTREQVSVSEGQLVVAGKRLPRSASQKTTGFSWEESVIWQGMEAVGSDGVDLGVISDATISLRTGAVSEIVVSGGATQDVAVGTRPVPGELVEGFDGERVVIRDLPDDVGYSGGAAAVAGKSVAVAKVRTEQAVTKAAEYGAKAAVYGAAAAKAAAQSETAKKARGALRAFGKMVQEATDPDEDE